MTWLDVAQFTREMPPNPAERLAFVATVIQVSVLPPAMHKALGRKGTVVGGAGLQRPDLDLLLEGSRDCPAAAADVSDVLGNVIAHRSPMC